eukprot:4453303-Amphidinium_carterae.2
MVAEHITRTTCTRSRTRTKKKRADEIKKRHVQLGPPRGACQSQARATLTKALSEHLLESNGDDIQWD